MNEITKDQLEYDLSETNEHTPMSDFELITKYHQHLTDQEFKDIYNKSLNDEQNEENRNKLRQKFQEIAKERNINLGD